MRRLWLQSLVCGFLLAFAADPAAWLFAAPAATTTAYLPVVRSQPVPHAVLVFASPPGAIWLPGEREQLRAQAEQALAFWQRWGPDHQHRPIVAAYEVATPPAPAWGNGGLTWADAYVQPEHVVLAIVQTRGVGGYFFARSYGYCDRRQAIAYVRSEAGWAWRQEDWIGGVLAHELGHCLYNFRDIEQTCPDDIMGYAHVAWRQQRPGDCTEATLRSLQ